MVPSYQHRGVEWFLAWILFTLHVLHKLDTLFNRCCKLWHHGLKGLLFIVRKITQSINFADAIWSELDLRREERHFRDVGFHIGALHDILDTVQSPEGSVSEESSSVGHRQGGTTLSSLGLDHLSTTVLRSLGQSIKDLVTHRGVWSGLGKEWKDGDSSMTTDDRHVNSVHVQSVLLGIEGLGSHDIQSGDSKELLWVVNSVLLQDLGSNWHSGVHWVGDHGDDGIWAVLRHSLDQTSDDASVDGKQVVTGHSRLSWYSCWDNDNIAVLQGVVKLLWTHVSSDLSTSVHVAAVSSNTRGVHNIVKGKLRDRRRHLHEQGKRLSDTSSGTHDSNLSFWCFSSSS
mmetsp:Transcript_15595/g.30012  ORF Transcript_15595/g.30012 Transcript_15595/m.30012 type:complete len:343 (+) Transcript_15595:57-1085(+)